MNFKQIISIILFFLPIILLWLLQIFGNNLVGEFLLSLLPIILLIHSIYLTLGAIFLYKLLNRKYFSLTIVLAAIFLAPFFGEIVSFYYTPNPLYTRQISDNAETLSIMSFNILFKNKDMESTLSAIQENKPDIILLYELTDEQYIVLQKALQLNYAYSSPSLTYAGNGVFAKKVLMTSEDIEIKIPNIEEASLSYRKILLNLNHETYAIYGIHPPAPITLYSQIEKRPYMNQLIDDINSNSADKIIIAGDFNMAPWSRSYQDFQRRTGDKFVDTTAGQGFDQTYSLTIAPFITLTHIDHIWVTPNVKVLAGKSQHILGSDHKALFTTLY